MGDDAPFTAPLMKVEPQWIDYNGHLNMAYYNLIFDHCTDALLAELGLGLDYVESRKASVFTLNAHIAYLQELSEGDPVRVTFRILDHDAKRLHGFQEMFHAEKGFLAATSETMSMHVDSVARKSAPFPPQALERIAAMRDKTSASPWPEGAGHVIAIQRVAGTTSGNKVP
jgi:acyl-CoA thioester hydrolase